MKELVDVYLAGYDVLMFAVCNPEKETINSPNRVVIYPLGNFSVSGEFQLLVAGNR